MIAGQIAKVRGRVRRCTDRRSYVLVLYPRKSVHRLADLEVYVHFLWSISTSTILDERVGGKSLAACQERPSDRVIGRGLSLSTVLKETGKSRSHGSSFGTSYCISESRRLIFCIGRVYRDVIPAVGATTVLLP